MDRQRRLERLYRPRVYVKKNYLGLPVEIKVANPTRFREKIAKVTYPLSLDLKKLVICGRRAMKREVLFAIKKAGRGKAGPKKRRYTEDSKVRC